MALEIVGLGSSSAVIALNILQLLVMAAIVVIAFFFSLKGRNWLGYLLALAILFLAAHNVLEILTEVEILSVAIFKTLATVFFLAAILFLGTQEKERLKLLGYSRVLENEVKARTREWENTFNSIPDFVSVHDRNFRFIRANKALANFLSVSQEELAGKHCYEIFHSLYNPPPNCPHPVALKQKRTVSREVKDPKSGIIMQVTTSPIFDEEGEVTGCVHIGRDITEQKEAEKNLRRSRERLQTIIENEPECVKVVDVDGTLLDMNPAGLAMIEADSLEQVLGESVIDIVAPEHRDAFREFLKEVYRGESDLLEFRIVGLKGISRWLESHAVPIVEEESGAVRILAITRDITERKKKGERIEAMSELSSAVASSMDMEEIFETGYEKIRKVIPLQLMLVALADEDKSSFQVSFIAAHEGTGEIKKGMEIPFAHTEALTTVYGRGVPALRWDLESKEEKCPLDKKLMEEGVKSYLWIPLISKDKEIGALCLGSYNRENFGEEQIPIAQEFANQLAVGIENAKLLERLQKELDTRKKAEGELEETNKELQQAYEDLKSVDRLKSNIIANVSHELLTPITIIKGTLELMREEDDREGREELIQRGVEAVERQGLIIDDLVEAGKQFERGGMQVSMAPVSMGEVIGRTLEDMKSKLNRKNLEIEVSVEEELPLIRGDKRLLHHALRNLIHNAIKFTSRGGKIGVKAYREEGAVKVCVSDTGIGIPEDEKDKIFQRFYQVESSKNRKYPGTGMGLAIVSDVVNTHGGKITVESEEKKGSTFCFTLPQV